MRFQVGDTVKIGSKITRYGNSKNNPKYTKGKIVSIILDCFISVVWSNGHASKYVESDLKLYKKAN